MNRSYCSIVLQRAKLAVCHDPNLRKRGFTLIELLVVVSIIALLVSILLPSLRSARYQARLVKCLSNLRGLGQSGMVFTADHGGRFQLAADEGAINRADPKRRRFEYDIQKEILSWPVALALSSGMKNFDRNFLWGVRANDWAEAKSREEFMSNEFPMALCPSDRVKISSPFYPRDGSLKPLPPELKLPEGSSYWGRLSYGINEDIVGSDDLSGERGEAPDCWKNDCRGQRDNCAGERLEGNLDRVFDPGTCLLLADAGADSEAEAGAPPEDGGGGGFANLFISAKARGPTLADFQVSWRKRMPKKRHPKGSINVLFADFHGQTVLPVEFWGEGLYAGIPKKYNTQVRVSPYRPWREAR